MKNITAIDFSISRTRNLFIPRNNKSIFTIGRSPKAADNYKEGLFESEHWIVSGNPALSRQVLQLSVDSEGNTTFTLVSDSNDARLTTNLLSPNKIDLINGIGTTLKLSQLYMLSFTIETNEKNIRFRIYDTSPERITIKRLF